MPFDLTRTTALLDALGRHAYAQSPHQLTLPEMGSLVISAGVEAGFAVQVEVPVMGRATMDCIWMSLDGHRVVAFEFDGRDVRPPHILGRGPGHPGNLGKFNGCGAAIKVQALYSLRSEGVLAPQNGATDVLQPAVRVLEDRELMQGEILRLATQAHDHALAAGWLLAPGPAA